MAGPKVPPPPSPQDGVILVDPPPLFFLNGEYLLVSIRIAPVLKLPQNYNICCP